MLAGMPTHYHVSCRVRNSEWGIDAEVTEQADEVIETNGTAFAALTQWLLNKDSWLTATPEAIKTLVARMNSDAGHGQTELAVFGWDSHADGGMKNANDWETGDITIDEEKHTVEMNGTACLSEFEFELVVKPHDPNAVSSEETAWDADEADDTKPYDQARILLELSERIFQIAPIHGVDQGDYDRLRSIAANLDEQAVRDHLNEHDD